MDGCDSASAIAAVNGTAVNGTASEDRSWIYRPPANIKWGKILTKVIEWGSMPSLMAEKLTFTAMPSSRCPEASEYCVPFPGMEFNEVGPMCVFALSSAAMEAAGSAVTDGLGAVGKSLAGMRGKKSQEHLLLI